MPAICTNPTYGWDPECFLVVGGSSIPLGGLIPGTKATPFRIDENGHPDPAGQYAVSEDGVALETNTPVVSDPDNAVRVLQQSFTAAGAFLTRYAPFKDFLKSDRQAANTKMYTRLRNGSWEFVHRGEWDFGGDLFLSPGAMMMGCDPDYNAYSVVEKSGVLAEAVNPRPDIRSLDTIRMAGCHLHIGYTVANMPNYVLAIFCDILAQLAGVQDTGYRRQHYGKPGNFRPTPYGLEYRSLSAGAVMSQERLRRFVHGVHALLAKDVAWVKEVWSSMNVFDVQACLMRGSKTPVDGVLSQLLPSPRFTTPRATTAARGFTTEDIVRFANSASREP